MLELVKTQPRAGRLLVVDDDEEIRTLFQRVLVREGHEVQTAVNADDALELAQAGQFDAIIVDWRMPLVNGFGFLYRLRSQERYRDIPVAIVTGDCTINEDVMTDVRALGAQLVFKPVGLKALVELARTLLTTPAPQQK